MGSDIREIRARVAEMIAANRAMLAPVVAQVRSRALDESPDARWLLERLADMLNAHIDELDEHLRRLGGEARLEPVRSNLTGQLLATAARSLDTQPLARALRNYYTALSLAHAGALILETDARAHGYSSTAAMATRHREEIAMTLSSIRDLLPAAIKEEIAAIQPVS